MKNLNELKRTLTKQQYKILLNYFKRKNSINISSSKQKICSVKKLLNNDKK